MVYGKGSSLLILRSYPIFNILVEDNQDFLRHENRDDIKDKSKRDALAFLTFDC